MIDIWNAKCWAHIFKSTDGGSGDNGCKNQANILFTVSKLLAM